MASSRPPRQPRASTFRSPRLPASVTNASMLLASTRSTLPALSMASLACSGSNRLVTRDDRAPSRPAVHRECNWLRWAWKAAFKARKCFSVFKVSDWVRPLGLRKVNLPAIFHRFANTSRQLRSSCTLLGHSGSCMTASPSLTRIIAARKMLCAMGGTSGPKNDKLPDELMSRALWQIDSMTGSVLWIAARSLGSYVAPGFTIPR